MTQSMTRNSYIKIIKPDNIKQGNKSYEPDNIIMDSIGYNTEAMKINKLSAGYRNVIPVLYLLRQTALHHRKVGILGLMQV